MIETGQFGLKWMVLQKRLRKKLSRHFGNDLDGAHDMPDAVSIPKTIWMYWHQGWNDAPALAHLCAESWERNNPGWTVRRLDLATAQELCDVEFPYRDRGIAHYADILRVDLLRTKGGVWADATCLCAAPLDSWLPKTAYTGFFAFAKPFPDRPISNWFLAGAPGNPVLDAWSEAMHAYWSKNGKAMIYLIHHALFERLMTSHPDAKKGWAMTPQLPAQPCHAAQFFLKGFIPRDALDRIVQSGGAPVHKLSRKLNVSDEELFGLLREIAPETASYSSMPASIAGPATAAE